MNEPVVVDGDGKVVTPDNNISEFEYSAGLWFRGQVRKFLKMEIFRGREIKFLESKGILINTFLVRGNKKDINGVLETLRKWEHSGKEKEKQLWPFEEG